MAANRAGRLRAEATAAAARARVVNDSRDTLGQAIATMPIARASGVETPTATVPALRISALAKAIVCQTAITADETAALAAMDLKPRLAPTYWTGTRKIGIKATEP